MHYYYITGVSRGIGKALVEELLKNENNYVIGIGRTNALKHERFEFIKLDLMKLDLVKEFRFIQIIDAQSITLVNNAGMLGNVNHVGKLDNQSIIDSFSLNTIAPAILMNNFALAYQQFDGKKLVLNISSGAGRHTIESWSCYCGSKSALDMYTAVAETEQAEFYKSNPVKFLSVAPGIIDTQMQNEIRAVDKSRFNKVDTFINYKEEGKLTNPKDLARQLIDLIDKSTSFNNPLLDIRELY
ncbi:MAG: SDR family NAD(P)-dependent oxidoreductase [Bacteroidales bacterium]|nr:SDR family NAD(P)-dependent oxidoreductase [Bacteroidales bacterium]